MIVVFLLATALAGAAPAAAPAHPPVAGTAVQADANEEAKVQVSRELARLYMPVDIITQIEAEKFDEGFEAQILKAPNVAAAEALAPGAVKAIMAAGRPFVISLQRSATERAQVELTKVFARHLTMADIVDLTSFYRSAEGRSILTKLARGVDVNATLAKIVEDPDYKVTRADVNHNLTTAVTNGVRTFTEEERKLLITKSMTPPFQHLNALSGQIAAIVIDVRNTPDPEIQSELETAMAVALKAHMEQAAGK